MSTVTDETQGRKKTLSELADDLEEEMLQQLDPLPAKSVLYTAGDVDPTNPPPAEPQPKGRLMLMGDDPRLPKMPEQPTLMDFYRLRMAPRALQHLLQSANLARTSGASETVGMACLLHDVAVGAVIRADHGYWGAQRVEPYVTEEVAWSIRAHQALRFWADEAAGYKYPQNYVDWFGAGYRPDPYVEALYREALNHKWYMTARLITVNDLYSFDPNVHVELEDFTDIIGRNFRQPEEGLGFDNSPTAHMWRTMIRPTKFL